MPSRIVYSYVALLSPQKNPNKQKRSMRVFHCALTAASIHKQRDVSLTIQITNKYVASFNSLFLCRFVLVFTLVHLIQLPHCLYGHLLFQTERWREVMNGFLSNQTKPGAENVNF